MKTILHVVFFFSVSCLLNGCIEETFPTSTATAGQVGKSPAALEALANSTAAFMNYYDLVSSSYAYDIGYPALMIWRETMLQDYVPNPDNSWFQFPRPFSLPESHGDTRYVEYIWYYYYTLIKNANNIVGAVDISTASGTIKQYLGCGLVYRAMAYMESAQLFEYRKTGIAGLDGKAESQGCLQLTVPIVLPEMTGEQGMNNPRVPFYTMYRFIMNDLNDAEEYLATYQPSAKNMPDVTVVYGMKARLWMEIATRCRLDADALALLVEHDADENGYDALGVKTVQACYQKASDYASRALAAHTPLTREEWHNAATGFNSSAPSAWMFAIVINPDAVGGDWRSFPGYIVSEMNFGIAGEYGCYKGIDKQLFDRIGETDWRKTSWIAPEDTGKDLASLGGKYVTNSNLDAAKWQSFPAYTNLKFRPKGGELDAYKTACAVDIPLMRVEEMYFIQAEAMAFTEGVVAGCAALENFMNTYRYTDHSYRCKAADTDSFIDELLVQKRVEFWGEGILAFDYKRLAREVIRGYPGSTMPARFQYNSVKNCVAPWMNLYIPEKLEARVNKGIVPNPDASAEIATLKYKK